MKDFFLQKLSLDISFRFCQESRSFNIERFKRESEINLLFYYLERTIIHFAETLRFKKKKRAPNESESPDSNLRVIFTSVQGFLRQGNSPPVVGRSWNLDESVIPVRGKIVHGILIVPIPVWHSLVEKSVQKRRLFFREKRTGQRHTWLAPFLSTSINMSDVWSPNKSASNKSLV